MSIRNLPLRILPGTMVCAFLLFGFGGNVSAQTEMGKITVVVTNDSLESVPEVVITLNEGSKPQPIDKIDNNRRRLINNLASDASESREFRGLAPLSYVIKVYSQNAVIPSSMIVELLPGQRVVRYFKISDSGPGISAARGGETLAPSEQTMAERLVVGQQGERIASKQLTELPNPNQSEAPLIERQTGVLTTDTTSLGGFIFNGQPGSQNILREAGVSTSTIVRASTSFQDTKALFFEVAERQSLKKYKTFKVNTNNTPADSGTGTGGELIEEIDPGDPKEYHGEFYEYVANDAFSARNFFDFRRKPSLRFNLFGAKLSGPLIPDRLTAFFNYEGIRASSGNSIFAAAPKLSLASSADPAVAPLLRSFRAAGASVLSGASQDANFDILQLEAKNLAERDSVTVRLDYYFNNKDRLGFIYEGSRAKEDVPDGASGRRTIARDNSDKTLFNYELTRTAGSDNLSILKNQFFFAVINAPSRLFARLDGDPNGAALFSNALTIGDEVTHNPIEGQPLPLAVSPAGGLLGGDFSGRQLRLIPRQFSFIDQMELTTGNHKLTWGGEARLLRTKIDRLFGTSYNFATLNDFLLNHADVDHTGDLGSLTANAGEREARQNYYIGYLQDAWKIHTNLLFTFGLRYEYYTALREAQQSVINIDPVTGRLVPTSEDLYKSSKNNFLPRVSFAWAPHFRPELLGVKADEDLGIAPLVFSGSFGMHVGPDVFDNIVSPITNNHLHVTGTNLAFPVNLSTMIASNDASNSEFKPTALARDYSSPQRVYKFDFTVKKELLGRKPLTPKPNEQFQEFFVQLAYVGNRSRNLLLRNFANRIVSVETNPNPELPARIRREFDFEDGGELKHPYGEFEFLTTGGRASYDSFQMSLKGRLKDVVKTFQVDYTLGRNRGNSDGDDAIPTGNPLNFDNDFGFNALDVRHKFTFTTVVEIPCGICQPWPETPWLNRFLNDWTVASIGLFQSGAPIDIRLNRPDVVYIDQAGKVFSKPATGRTAVLNVPGGGSSVAAYRPNLIPGANLYLNSDRNYLNPGAFSIPDPGQLGTLTRGALRGPHLRLVDLSVQKVIKLEKKKETNWELTFNMDVTNLFNFTNFKMTKAKLPNKLGTDASDNQLQPGQAFTEEAAGTFGILTSTFKRKSDLGSSRQIQFGLSLKF